jgi:hypothetical protein
MSPSFCTLLQGQGGAVYARQSSLEVETSAFLNNSASVGGAVYAGV